MGRCPCPEPATPGSSGRTRPPPASPGALLLRDRLHALGHGIERRIDELRRRLKERAGGYGPLDLLVYAGHGNPGYARVRGRVLEERGERPLPDDPDPLRVLAATYRRFETDEVPGAAVVIRGAGGSQRVHTDEEGYFDLHLRGAYVPEPDPEGWGPVTVAVEAEPARGIPAARTVGRVRIPSPDADFGIVSDVDDTILQTGATSLLALFRNTFLTDVRDRLPFEGVADLYRALEAGPGGAGRNPLFYVSSSPWNLYDVLVDFMEIQDIPPGPLFLQDIGLDAGRLGVAHHLDHKLAAIDEILELHAGLDFVLLGDTGQRDPEVYRAVVERHPGRVRAVFVRDVADEARDREVDAIGDDMARLGVPFHRVADSADAAAAAVDLGLVDVERARRLLATRPSG